MTTTVETTLLAPSDPPTIVAREPDAARHPHRKALHVVGIGFATIVVALLAIGLLLRFPLDHSVGAWDEHVNEYFARHRSPGWNDITKIATSAFNTVPVVVASMLIVGFLVLRKHVREAAFLTLALLLEITAFLSVTFVVARPRPDVVRLNSTPATSSFPSGHTAAATVLFVGLAVIVTCCTAHVVLRLLADALAVVVVAAVGFARVYRGLHHPTDVMVGAAFGLACLVVAGLAVRAHGDAWRARSERAPEGRQREAREALQR